jgi:hypothetical protein
MPNSKVMRVRARIVVRRAERGAANIDILVVTWERSGVRAVRHEGSHLYLNAP